MKKLLILFTLALSLGFLGGCGSKDKVVVKEVEKENPIIEEQDDAAEDTPKTEKKEDSKVETDEKEEKLAEVSKTVELEGASFKVPNDFEQVDAGQIELPYILFSIDGTASFNLVVEDISVAPNITLKEYVDISTSKTDFDYQSIDYYELNGMEANDATSFKNENWKMQQTTILNDDKAYIFTYGNVPEKFDEQLPLIREILNTVAFNN